MGTTVVSINEGAGETAVGKCLLLCCAQVKMHRADDEMTHGRKVYVGAFNCSCLISYIILRVNSSCCARIQFTLHVSLAPAVN